MLGSIDKNLLSHSDWQILAIMKMENLDKSVVIEKGIFVTKIFILIILNKVLNICEK